MKIELEKTQIIEDVPEEHKQILDSRIDAYESGNAKTIEWEEAKERLSIKKYLRP